jgi:acyl-CoA synthetase (AMP-forming)/AMP-acid ligase II
MKKFTSIPEMIAIHAKDTPAADAITAPAAKPLTYQALNQLVEDTVNTLNRLGVGRGDRIGIVLPNCPEMATAFVAIASGCTAAPLNMAYRADEFEFYLLDLKARALVVAAGSDTPAREVAAKLGIAILELTPHPEKGAGSFTLDGPAHAGHPIANGGLAQTGDIALILHTSGTTSRPKIVPLTHRNVSVSAHNISTTLRLKADDRELHIMPLFHIHGLIAGVLAPMAVGSQIFCTPGFNALKFFGWMKECRPTWYTAVPTMHQTILSRASHNLDVIESNPLRFIRSSSSSMPTKVISELEKVFNAPLIESYGMTEAAHQMASNPLPPDKRIPGSVGIAAGPEVAIMDHEGNFLASGLIGEVVIRGESVTQGYENNPKANAEAFVDGWFRTGDQGVLSPDGYLTLTGRLKEIINRGGENISPLEVDEVLMHHPAVMQVVTFAVPHEKLGEEVAAAVVLREGFTLTERELHDFAEIHLADFKVPKKILFMAEIPKGATGKLQRIGLAAKLGLTG